MRSVQNQQVLPEDRRLDLTQIFSRLQSEFAGRTFSYAGIYPILQLPESRSTLTGPVMF